MTVASSGLETWRHFVETKIFQILLRTNYDTLQFWHFQILKKNAFWHFSILTLSSLSDFCGLGGKKND